ncbi:hypothetical protein B0T20DRAFT_483204 [Sordaria brevicollis]|uniref:FHA domain-containing protein n=1 Tax=Sordaria brevicollis TaxID=83679 RepID=A0AAE0U666_SORBR|nr:hypothetical protein B0T20DRAFT_483204 [Sordaria brevicollis]
MAVNSDSSSASTGNLPAFSISLTQYPYADQPFSRRYIVLDSKSPILKIGRSSKLASKGFVPSSQNGWYDSPVMSRQHAEIIADFTTKRLKLRDLGSLHGTYVNGSDQRLDKNQEVEIKDGDNIRFGVDIMRKKTFPPTNVKLGVDYIELPRDKPESDTTRPRASSTFRVPDGSDSDMECLDEEPILAFDRSPKGTAVGRGLGGLHVGGWKTDVIDLTYPVSGSSKLINNQEKEIVDLDQDDPFNQPRASSIDSIDSIDSNRSNYGSNTGGRLSRSVDYVPLFPSHVVDDDSGMSSDYEPEYEPEPAGSEASRDLSDVEYDYPYSESDSDFSVGQDSDAESESDEGWGFGEEAAEAKFPSHWALPDLSNIVTGPASVSHAEAAPNQDKRFTISRLVTPEPKENVVNHNTPPAFSASPGFSADSLPSKLIQPPDVHLVTPQSNKAAEEAEKATPTLKSQNSFAVDMAEDPWYPPDKAEFFQAWKANKASVTHTLPASSHYARVAISDMLGENDSVGGSDMLVDDVSDGKGKRKAEEISSTTEEELRWNAGDAQNLLGEESGAHETEDINQVMADQNEEEKVIETTEAPNENAKEIAVTVESLPMPVATSSARIDVDDDGDMPRPAKRQRLRNIAERVGYVALGGVATGAMMFGALVYTAPTFV